MRPSPFFSKPIFSVLLILCFSAATAQTASYYIQKADSLFNIKNYDLAITNYTKAVAMDQGVATYVYNGRGKAYTNKNQFDLAIKDFNSAINLSPNYAITYGNRGYMWLQKNEMDSSIRDLTKAISLDPNYILAYANRGYSYYKKKQYDLAIKDYSKAISLNPNYTWAYSNRGYAYLEKNEIDSAIQDQTKAISLAPNSAISYVDRGAAYTKKTNFDLAIKDFNTAIGLSPNYSGAFNSRGFANLKKNQLDSALQDYNKAIQLDPKSSAAYFNRGYVYSQKRNYDQSIQDYTIAITLGNNAAINYANRGYSWSMKYQYDLALQDISTAITISPSTASYYSNRGFYFNNIGKYDSAIQDFKTCLAKDPEYVYPYINIISPLVRMQQLKEATAIYNQYKQKKLTSYVESDKYKFYRSFITAVTQVADGKMKEAMVSLDSASKQYGTEIKEETKRAYIDILFLRGYILEKLNRDEEAKNIFEQSLVIDARQPDINEALQRLQQKQTVTRNIDKDGPEITLINPAPSRGFDILSDNAKTQIIGKAKDIAGIKTVTINGAPVEKIEEDGLFISNLVLKSGANSLVIMATDKQGNTASKTFVINTNSIGNNTQVKPDQAMSPAGAPVYYAILIAEKDYDDPGIPDLQNPVKDAKELKAILEKNYTFNPANIDTLYNRSREDIMQAIVQRCNTLTENDNLIIFYAGHGIGEKDKFGDVDGYWIPVSARKDLNASYISSDDINKAIKRSNAKHILVIADACFSGAFTRSLPADATKEITKQYAVSSRKIMASGNLEPVPDNSKFLFYLKKSLTENKEKYISAKDLFDGFYKAILSNSDNLPQYAAIKNVGDEGGEFIFIKR